MLRRKPKFNIGDRVKVVEVNLHKEKGYGYYYCSQEADSGIWEDELQYPTPLEEVL